MKYLVDAERPVFLHFLNREAATAAKQNRPTNEDLIALDVITLCHCSKMTVNISQMIEYSSDNSALVEVLSALSRAEILITTSHEGSLENFLDSRKKMYRSVSSKYPMYFEDTSTVGKFKIAQANSFSMTGLLRRDIMDFDPGKLNLIGRFAREDDLIPIRENIEILQYLTFNHKEEAVTRSNFEAIANKNSISANSLDSIGRVFSAFYFEHYADQNGAATCTGMGTVGYVDDLRLFPHYDIALQRNLLNALGWESLKAHADRLRAQMYATYGSKEHRRFVELINAFLHACLEQVKASSNSVRSGTDSVESIRAIMSNFGMHLIHEASGAAPHRSLLDFYVRAGDTLMTAAANQSRTNLVFKTAWEQNVPARKSAKMVLLTATDKEDDALAAALLNAGYLKGSLVPAGEGYGQVYTFGTSKEVVHVRSNAGSLGSSGSTLVSVDAINALNASYVIAVGICFGFLQKKHKLGDILVSQEVQDYEMVRQEDGRVRERGPRQPAGSRLLSAAQIARQDYATSDHKAYIGLIMSGQKLMDSWPDREALRRRFPDALGGEMEAAGLMSAASRTKSEWLMIKAICDWGYGKSSKSQEVAAQNAAGFAIKVINYTLDADATRIVN